MQLVLCMQCSAQNVATVLPNALTYSLASVPVLPVHTAKQLAIPQCPV